MEKKKIKMPSFHTDLDAFIPATDAEKEYIVQMRPSSTFFKDGVKRLLKNKIATASLLVMVIIILASILIPMFWPYSYEAQLGNQPGKPVDASYNNLAPFEYGATEQKRIEAGEKVFPIFSERMQRDGIILSVWYMVPVSPWLSVCLQVLSC